MNQTLTNQTALNRKSIEELAEIAKECGIENISQSRKQDIVYKILKTHADKGEDICGEGVLEILPDNFGFLR